MLARRTPAPSADEDTPLVLVRRGATRPERAAELHVARARRRAAGWEERGACHARVAVPELAGASPSAALLGCAR